MISQNKVKRIVTGWHAFTQHKHVFRAVALVFLFLTVSSISVYAETSTPGTISKVTVYRGQALVTRTIEVKLPAGASELVVTDLPQQILPETIYAQTPENITVLSVRYRERAVREDTREEVKKLDAQIELLQKKMYHTEMLYKHNQDMWAMFVKLQDFSIKATKEDLMRGLLSFEPLEKLTSHIEEKGVQYHDRGLELYDEMESQKKEMELLQRKRKELAAGRSHTEREAVLYLKKDDARPTTLDLNYLVNGANWSPQYNLRAQPNAQQVLIEYNAVVHQTSGENWTNVDLALSTAQPTMAAAPPTLEPMVASLTSRVAIRQQPAQQGAQQQVEYFDNTQKFQKLLQSRRANIKKGKAAQADLNLFAAGNQVLIYNADVRELQEMQQQAAEIARTEGVSVTYKLPGRLTLPSRSDQQLVTIAAIPAKAEFTLIATPLLTDYVYLQADLLNNSDTILLPGPASMFRNGDFCGQSDIGLVTIGEKFTAGFGIDSQIQITRELEDKNTHIQGGNRIDTYNYRIALANYKENEVKIRLLDRLPYTKNSSIKIELGETSTLLSKDSEYLRTLRKKNILRWDLDLKSNTIGKDATVVTYTFTMEYDRNMQIQSQTQRQ
jgi:uncharacterized protein (TIGR02231 family)